MPVFLEELRYEYPAEPVPAGRNPDAQLAQLHWQGAARRYPDGIPEKVRSQIEHELALIAELRYAAYFLTVQDIVRFARSRGILSRAAALRRTPPSVTASESPPSIPPGWTCCLSGSSPPNAMSRPISTWISNMNAAKR